MKPRAKVFHFTSRKFENSKATFNFKIEFSNAAPLRFTETLIFPNPKNSLPKQLLDSLHLILGISYYKLYCPPKVQIPYKLSTEQADFWTTVYRKGLAEFAFRNKLDPQKLAKFPHRKTQTLPARIITRNESLLGIGGGKDSIVAGELLKENNENFTAFLLETQKPDAIAENVIKEMKVPALKIRRALDPKIFEKHEGSYNGHIPISAIFAFVGLAAAALYAYKNVIVGNEHSSNFGNVKDVNHQWSKSSEFESMLQNYTRKFISPDITYFSLLRQFYEIRVAELFAKHKNYFDKFSSCNKNFRIKKERINSLWCGECAKCLFVYTILSPYIPKKELVKIFGKNLLADRKLKPLLKDITGRGKMKPFDCVGTFEEASAALAAALAHTPSATAQKVYHTVPAPTLPPHFKFFGIKNACIIGYGREGKVTESYLKKTFPKLQLTILDQNLDKNYLEHQKDFDLAIKTPGIPKTKVTIPYTTATNLFFEIDKTFKIGVTGSKGKSTTATLIYEILKAAGKKVQLLGNIGKPMLAALDSKAEISVIELSSYMLDDIAYSPDIAVLLNLFPEHMNYHGGVQKYYDAKLNIFKFNPTIIIRPPYSAKIPTSKTALLGPHNRKNIQAAVLVARALKIPDSVISRAIENFKPLRHRLEYVGMQNGIKFYDDGISTTPESTIMAVKTLKNIGTILLGGEDRGYKFSALERVLRAHKIPNIVLFPDSGPRMLRSRAGFNILETRSMKSAVAFALANTKPGQICLLSTASPSYSLWKNFEEKGDEFRACIQ